MVGRRHDGGYALPLALGIAAVVVLAVLAMSTVVQGRQSATGREARRIRAVAAADAAFAETLARLAEDRHFGGVGARAFGGGTISSRVRPRETDVVEVRATGSWRDLTVRIDAIVEVDGRPRILMWERGFGRGGG